MPRLLEAGAERPTEADHVSFQKFSGGHFDWYVSRTATNLVNYSVEEVDQRALVRGAQAHFLALPGSWSDVRFYLKPEKTDSGVFCKVQFGVAAGPMRSAEVVVPMGGGLLWGAPHPEDPKRYQLVLLQEGERAQPSAPSGAVAKSTDSRVSHLLRDAKLLYELGKSEEARLKLLKALDVEPNNEAAHYYMDLIEEQKLARRAGARLTRPQLLEPAVVTDTEIAIRARVLEVPESALRLFWETAGAELTARSFTESEVTEKLARLEAAGGVKTLATGTIVTLSGRQSQLQWTEAKPIVREEVEGSTPKVTEEWVGTLVDLIPVLENEPGKVRLTAAARHTQFLGYDDPGTFMVAGREPVRVKPIPRFRVWRAGGESATVWDGSTLVLGSSRAIETDQVPEAPTELGTGRGDQGDLRQQASAGPETRRVLVLLTPTLSPRQPAATGVQKEQN